MTNCENCKTKPCESPYNEGECWFNILAEYVAAGGELTDEMVQQLTRDQDDLPTPRP